MLLNSHDRQSYHIGVSPQELFPLQGVVPRGTRHQVWPFLHDPFLHLRLDKPQIS